MNTGKNKAVVRRYLKEVRKKLVCKKSLKNIFLRELKERIRLFQSSDREITEEILYEEFGSPDDITASFFNREDYNELLQKARKQATRWKITCGVITVLILIVLHFLIFYIRETDVTFRVSDPYISTPQSVENEVDLP